MPNALRALHYMALPHSLLGREGMPETMFILVCRRNSEESSAHTNL